MIYTGYNRLVAEEPIGPPPPGVPWDKALTERYVHGAQAAGVTDTWADLSPDVRARLCAKNLDDRRGLESLLAQVAAARARIADLDLAGEHVDTDLRANTEMWERLLARVGWTLWLDRRELMRVAPGIED